MACGDEDNIMDLHGAWSIKEVTCECQPDEFRSGDNVWNFDLTKSQVLISNQVQRPLQIFESGVYDFILTDSTILIGDIRFDYFFEGRHLLLADEPEVDGPLITFERSLRSLE